MLAKVPDLRGKRVLALGCGTGEECTALLERGALHIVGVDRSEAMLALARQAFAADPRVHFACMDMCRLGLARYSFDYVYSSLALHYACNWREVLTQVRVTMTQGARLLLSTHHPMVWGADICRGPTEGAIRLGYRNPRNEKEPVSVYGDYFSTRRIEDRRPA
jgi:ubiquinone/menaquinone biosynthesis C-methylase UbiE